MPAAAFLCLAKMSSMNVHSLIDKFTNANERPPVPRSRSGPPALELHKRRASSQESIHSALSALYPRSDIKESAAQFRSAPPPARSNTEFSPDPALLALLGPDITSFPLGETAFVEALRLRAEQERSKQEQIRLEIASKNLSIIQAAIQNEVPPHLIPSMCVGSLPQGASAQQPMQQSSQLPVHPQATRRGFPSGDYANAGIVYASGPSLSAAPQLSSGQPGLPGPPGPPGQPSGSISIAGKGNYPHQSPFLAPSPSFSRSYETQDNASMVAPSNFRFGAGSKVGPPPPNRRPLSPAKIGAAAVANLANPITPYRPSHRTLPTHQRHFSMPVESLSPQQNLERSSKQRGTHNFQLQSPLGAMSSMQVRPTPAQPLSKQTKNSQIPSQESMTSFQHIIQFHQWKPENPGDREGNGSSSLSSESLTRGLFSHKRHKSNDMSIDLLQAPQETYLRQRMSSQAPIKQENEDDMSMDASDVTITELKDNQTTSESSQAGRFPHDILLSSR